MPNPVSSNTATQPTQSPDLAPIGPPPPPVVVTIEPVVIVGDAGTRELVKRHDAAAKDCREQAAGVGLGAVAVTGGALSTVGAAMAVAAGSAGGPIGLAGALVSLFAASVYEGKELRGLHDCKTP